METSRTHGSTVLFTNSLPSGPRNHAHIRRRSRSKRSKSATIRLQGKKHVESPAATSKLPLPTSEFRFESLGDDILDHLNDDLMSDRSAADDGDSFSTGSTTSSQATQPNMTSPAWLTTRVNDKDSLASQRDDITIILAPPRNLRGNTSPPPSCSNVRNGVHRLWINFLDGGVSRYRSCSGELCCARGYGLRKQVFEKCQLLLLPFILTPH